MNSPKIVILVTFFFNFNSIGNSQVLLNGDFEINSCTPGFNELNLSNSRFDSLMADCFSFSPSSPELDIITTNNWALGPKSGNWYVGIASPDMLAMKLSLPVSTGDTHVVSYYESGATINPCSNGLEIGLSSDSFSFGTLIYTSPSAAPIDLWTSRVFSFVAPINGQFLTVRSPNSPPCWMRIDWFCFDSLCINENPTQVSMPNVFSPNGDGINEIFKPIVFENAIEPSITIFNRWGEIVFETTDVANGWDGKNNGNKCPDGVYYWLLKYTNERLEEIIETGMVSLLSNGG